MRKILFIIFSILLQIAAFPSHAQVALPGQSSEPPQNSADGKVMFFVVDPAQLEKLQSALKKPEETKEEKGPALSLQQSIDGKLREIKAQIIERAQAFALIPLEASRAEQLMLADSSPFELTLTVIFLPVLFAIGLLAEWLLWQMSRRFYWRVIDVPRSRPIERLAALLFRIFYAFLSVAAFAIFSLGLFLTLSWPDVARLLIVTYLTIFIVLRLTWRLTKIVFSPKAEQLRLLPIDNQSARFFRSWIAIVIGLWVLFDTTGQVLRDVGFSENTKALFTLITSLVMVWGASYVILHGRKLLKLHSPQLSGRLLDFWPMAMVIGMIVSWFLYLIGFAPASGTLAILVFLPVLIRTVEAIVEKAVKTPPERPDSEEKSPEQQHLEVIRDAAKNTAISPFELIVERGLRSALIVGAAYWIAGLWGVDVISMAFSDPTKAPLASAAFNIVVTLLIADLIWQFIASFIDSRLKDVPMAGEHHDMSRREARLQTLLPILRLFLMVVVWVVTAMICLASLGVNIGPLLAGAGVIGIAIGFGTQTLVKDIISGIFFLLDDAFRVGEYIEFGNIRGTVEAMSLRSLRLRHHRGPLHTVPFGDLKAITNHSRDWVIEKLELGLTYDTDLELVRKTVKEIGKMMMEDPEVAPLILEPLKSQGVRALGDFSIKVRVKFKAKATHQFLVRRVAYKLIHDIFPQRGIKFAFPTVTIMGKGSEQEEEAGAAASNAAARLAIAAQDIKASS